MSHSRETTPLAAMEEYQRSMLTNQNPPSDPATIIENNIKALMETLSSIVGDISKDKQISNKKMEEINSHLKCLGDIDARLTEQLDIMQECLLSADFNACRPLNDHEAETYSEMETSLMAQIRDITNQKSYVPLFSQAQQAANEEVNAAGPLYDEDGGPSILKQHQDATTSEIDTSMHQVTFDDIAEERVIDEYENLVIPSDEPVGSSDELRVYSKEEGRKVKNVLRALQNEGWVLNETEQQWLERDDDEDADSDEDAPIPGFEDVTRLLERLIRDGKDKFKIADSNYKFASSFTDARRDEDKLGVLFAERKRIKVLLKNAIAVRNEIYNRSEDDIKARRKEKMRMKLERGKQRAEEEIHRVQMQAQGRPGFSDVLSNPSPPPADDAEMGDYEDDNDAEDESEEEIEDNFVADGIEYTYGKEVKSEAPGESLNPNVANPAEAAPEGADIQPEAQPSTSGAPAAPSSSAPAESMETD